MPPTPLTPPGKKQANWVTKSGCAERKSFRRTLLHLSLAAWLWVSCWQRFCLREKAGRARRHPRSQPDRSEEHTSELQSPMRISYAVFCLKKKKRTKTEQQTQPLDTTQAPYNYYEITQSSYHYL